MMEFTADTRLLDILNLPEFSEFKEFLFWLNEKNGMEILRGPMKQFGGVWNPHSMNKGLACLWEHCKAGRKVFYPLYNQKKAEECGYLKKRAMFHFPVENRTKFVVICAGGSYEEVCSILEGFPPAAEINELGYHAFVVHYRVGIHAKAPNPQDDLAAAIRYIIEHAEELNVKTEDYAVAGFSAGGHLAASYGTDTIGYLQYGLPRPSALFLSYPVVTMGKYAHVVSRSNLFGGCNQPDEEWIQKYSIERQITESYPPSYVWQCENDREVSIENTRLLIKELAEKKVKFLYKTYPDGEHGWGCGDDTPAKGWIKEAVRFWEEQSQ